jgi:ATP-dependent helicase Lhr and Lhr-like helicase
VTRYTRRPVGRGVKRTHRLPHVYYDDSAHSYGGRHGGLPLRGVVIEIEGSAEFAARVLLDRYGVVFRRLCTREPWLPPWRELVTVYRRREARGELRGGRFLALASGKQFALPEAVGLLRDVHRRAKALELVSLSGVDPLNLAGIITPAGTVPRGSACPLSGWRHPIASESGREVHMSEPLDRGAAWKPARRCCAEASGPPGSW